MIKINFRKTMSFLLNKSTLQTHAKYLRSHSAIKALRMPENIPQIRNYIGEIF